METLLSASKLEDISRREDLLVTATRLQLDPPDIRLRTKVVYQMSVMLRSQGRILESERVITEFLDNEYLALNHEPPLSLGILHLSQAKNQTYRFNFHRAREETSKWRPPDDLPDSAACSYVRVTVEDRLAGNAFACRWSYKNINVCWVTQLVVHSDFRERGLAAGLLNQLRQDDDAIYGLMSSHPAACLAAAKAFGSTRAYNADI